MYQRAYPQSWSECLESFLTDSDAQHCTDDNGTVICENWGPAHTPTVRVTPVNGQFPFCPFLVVAHGVPIFTFYPDGTIQYVAPPSTHPCGTPFFRDWAASIGPIRACVFNTTTQTSAQYAGTFNAELIETPTTVGPPLWRLTGVVFPGTVTSHMLPGHWPSRLPDHLRSPSEPITLSAPQSPLYLDDRPIPGVYLRNTSLFSRSLTNLPPSMARLTFSELRARLLDEHPTQLTFAPSRDYTLTPVPNQPGDFLLSHVVTSLGNSE